MLLTRWNCIYIIFTTAYKDYKKKHDQHIGNVVLYTYKPVKNFYSSKSESKELGKNVSPEIESSLKSFIDAPECKTSDESEEEESE